MKNLLLLTALLFFLLTEIEAKAQVPDPDQGLRADWLRGTWGINWKPVDLYNGGHEGLSIEPFLDQISHLKTIDYLQIHLGESSIKSSVHMGPHPLLESFWEGDTDGNGNPINLVVPRASYGEDPFLEIVEAIHAAGLKVMVYVNSSNMLNRQGSSNPDYIPNITERWKAWCDSDLEAQAFIASQPYHTGIWDADSARYIDATAQYPNRKYMFCYAEFVLKVYAVRYGNLIDGWCFDSGSYMVLNGDNATNGVYEDQRIFLAFAAACRAGNPNVACSFQNSPERDTEELNPFSEATHADDFMFGHPYNGGRDGGSHEIGDPPLYDRNYAHIEKMKETNGNVHSGIDPQTWTWDDNVVGHYDPPMSTTSWNGGNTPALTDEEFNLWNLEAVQNGGAISWGLPLVGKSSGNNNNYVANDWSLAQLNGMDTHLMGLKSPGAPNWARAETAFPAAKPGQAYTHVLKEGVDFWDPEDVGITDLSVAGGNLPEWLTITETEGIWTFSGTPTETQASDYTFTLRVEDPDGGTNREVTFQLVPHPDGFTNTGDGSPVWKSDTMVLSGAIATESYLQDLRPEVDFYDFEGDDLTVTITEGADWLTITEATQAKWQLSGTPSVADIGENNFKLTLSDGTHTSEAEVFITVGHPSRFTDLGDGSPVWDSYEKTLPNAKVYDDFTYEISELVDCYDFEGDQLTITKGSGAEWINIEEMGGGLWRLYGTPDDTDEGDQTFNLTVSDGSFSTDAVFQITVNPADLTVEDGYANAMIKATANTNYGVDEVAIMMSEELTAFDGKATFQLSIDVTPDEGKAITSGSSGGDATNKSWGLGGDGRADNKENMFFGDSLDLAHLGNIQVVSFEANGGDLTIEDFDDITIESLTIVNGQSGGKDAVALTVNGETSQLGNVETKTFSLGVNKVDSLSIGSGESDNQAANKWSVEGITVSINFNHLLTGTIPPISKVNGLVHKLYPNPTSGKITIEISNSEPATYSIFNQVGQRIMIDKISGGLATVDMSDLKSGIYFVRVQRVNETFTGKVIKQ